MQDKKQLEEAIKEAAKIASNPIISQLEEARKKALSGFSSDLMKAREQALHQYTMPKLDVKPLPNLKINFESVNEYSSAKILLQRLDSYYTDWSNKTDDDTQVAIYALLQNGAAITVKSLREEGFNGIVIEGVLNDSDCLLMLHQSSLQFLCVAEKVSKEMPRQKIGFIYQ
jgi:hypothetical protein